MHLDEVCKYKIDVATIQEIRWTGSEIIYKKNYSVYYSCHSNNLSGTRFIVSRKPKQQVTDFKEIDHRICYLRLKGRFLNFSLYNVYAPVNSNGVSPTLLVEFLQRKLRTISATC